MKKSKWYKAPDNEKFGKYKTIKNNVSSELELNGFYGFIWEYSPTHYRACITSHKISNKFIKAEEKYKAGDEALVTFPKKELDVWVKRLKIKNNRNSMLERAERFGKENET